MGVGKCASKENPKSDLDLDLGFVNSLAIERQLLKFVVISRMTNISTYKVAIVARNASFISIFYKLHIITISYVLFTIA